MEKIKKILLVCCIFILTGCSVEYNLTIYDDGSVIEKVAAQEETKKMESLTRLKGKQAVNYLYSIYKDSKSSSIITNTNSSMTKSVVTESYDNINDYIEKYSSDLFGDIIHNKDESIESISTKQKYSLKKGASYSPIYDDVVINITIPYKVIKNNADVVRNNTYTWKIGKDDLKSIELSYDTQKLANKANITINGNTYSFNYGIIIVCIFILVVISIIIFVYFKNKKSNIV